MHLWSAEGLEVFPLGDVQFALIPNGEHLLAIDGETQLTAHYELRRHAEPETRDLHGVYPVPAVIHHGVSVEDARLFFHDLNVLAVRPNTSLGLSMNTADPIMKTVAKVEGGVSFLNGRVERMARQLTKSSPKVVTMRDAASDGRERRQGHCWHPVRRSAGTDRGCGSRRRRRHVAIGWLSLFFETFRVEASDRENYLLTSSPVLSAIGAMGNLVINAPHHQRDDLQKKLLESLQTVNWRKGAHWQGIAGHFSRGVFTVSGTKEVGYGVFNVLADPHNPNYLTVRSGSDGTTSVPPSAAEPTLMASGEGETAPWVAAQ